MGLRKKVLRILLPAGEKYSACPSLSTKRTAWNVSPRLVNSAARICPFSMRFPSMYLASYNRENESP